MNILINSATVDDADEILTLQKLAYQSEAELYGDFAIPPLTQTWEEIRNEFETTAFLKAVDGERIVGSVRGLVESDACLVGRLIVHPDCQNRGLGTRLMNAIEKQFAHVDRFELFTGHKSERNLYLYKKLGYLELKTQRINERLSLIFLEKKNPFRRGGERGKIGGE